MCDHRERAVQREVDRQNQQRNKLLAQVQDILDQSEVSGKYREIYKNVVEKNLVFTRQVETSAV